MQRVFIGCSDRILHCTLRVWQHHCDGITSMAKAQEKGLIFFFFFLLLLSLLCVMQNEGRERIKEGELNYNK